MALYKRSVTIKITRRVAQKVGATAKKLICAPALAISWLRAWRGAKVYNQTGWGPGRIFSPPLIRQWAL